MNLVPDKKYIGNADNLKERLEAYNSGGSMHTKVHKAWELYMVVEF